MGKHLDYIQKLNDISTQLCNIINELWNITKKTSDKEFEAELCKFVSSYSALNYKLATFLISKTIEAHKQDNALLDKIEFEDIISKLKKEIDNEEA